MKENENEEENTKKKDNFLLYHNMYKFFKALSDEKAGKVIKSIFEYSIDEKIPEFEEDSAENFLFMSVQNSIDINTEKYYKKCEQNRKNINKRWNDKNDIKEESDHKEVVFVNNEMLTENEYKSRFKEFTYQFEDLLYMERELVKKGEVEKIKTNYNNSAISEETIKKYIKIR
jgi:hypothetical protein